MNMWPINIIIRKTLCVLWNLLIQEQRIFRTTDGDVTECEWRKQRAHPPCSGVLRMCDSTKHNGLVTLLKSENEEKRKQSINLGAFAIWG